MGKKLHDRILSAKELRNRIPYHPTHLARLEKDGKFPKRIKLNPNGRVGWSEFEIDEYIKTLKAARDTV
jgi:prophage regulatory protein